MLPTIHEMQVPGLRCLHFQNREIHQGEEKRNNSLQFMHNSLRAAQQKKTRDVNRDRRRLVLFFFLSFNYFQLQSQIS